jgi:hypothetical protein
MTAFDFAPAVSLDPAALLGTWRNTNAESRGITRVDVADEEDVLRVAVWGTEAWGSVLADPFTVDGFESRTAMAFSATFELEAASVRLQANIKGGVLVVAILTRNRDGRANTFTREFYYRVTE